jgi:hypothetical protein
MKILLMSLLMLSLSLLTACGGSGGSGDSKVDSVSGDSNLDTLPLTIIASVDEYNLFAFPIPEYKDTNNYEFSGVDGDKVKLSREGAGVVFNTAPNLDNQGVYNFIMTVTNVALQTKNIDVTLNIIDVVSNLDTLLSEVSTAVSENQRFALTIPEHKTTNTYQFTGADGDNVKYWAERGEVIFKYAPDFETQPSYNFIMTVTNAEQQAKDIDVTIDIVDVSNDFIFEILPGTDDGFHLQFNSSSQQDQYDTYSFDVKRDGVLEQSYSSSGSGDVTAFSVQIKGNEDVLTVAQEITLSPTTDDGLPSMFFWMNTLANTVNIKVIQWGDNPWRSLEGIFTRVCSRNSGSSPEYLSFSALQNSPNLSQVENVKSFLKECNFHDNLSYWDVSKIKSMDQMFVKTTGTADLSQWDVSSVMSMGAMFAQAQDFNADLSQWDVSSVISMQGMFAQAQDFNADLSQWDVSSVISMQSMFAFASDFDSDISEWIVSSVNNMATMFTEAEQFNQDIRKWDVDQVIVCVGFKQGGILSDAHTPEFSCEIISPPIGPLL